MNNLIKLEIDFENNKVGEETLEIRDFIFSYNLKHLIISFKRNNLVF